MGRSFTNCHVRTTDAQAVADALTTLAIPAFVSDAANGWVSVYAIDDNFDGDVVAARLAEHLNMPVLNLWEYDSDVGGYKLFEGGTLRDEYQTDPDYGAGDLGEDGEPIPHKSLEEIVSLAGNPDVLLPHCMPGTTTEAIRTALSQNFSYGDYLVKPDPDTVLPALTALLGIESDRYDSRFRDFAIGDTDVSATLIGAEHLSLEDKNAYLGAAAGQIAFSNDSGQSAIKGIERWLVLGADPNAYDSIFGWNTLHCAVRGGNAKVIRFLLEAGVDSSRRDNYGQTPLGMALKLPESIPQRAEIIESLRAARATE